jgi:hypothetical protein
MTPAQRSRTLAHTSMAAAASTAAAKNAAPWNRSGAASAVRLVRVAIAPKTNSPMNAQNAAALVVNANPANPRAYRAKPAFTARRSPMRATIDPTSAA